MIEPIHSRDPRRSLAIIKIIEDIKRINHRLDIASTIPFDTPIIIIQRWILQDFTPLFSTLIVHVTEMDNEYLRCLIYASDNKYLFPALKNESILSMSELVQWRLLDKAFLCTTVNWEYKSEQYQQLFSKEMPDEEPQSGSKEKTW